MLSKLSRQRSLAISCAIATLAILPTVGGAFAGGGAPLSGGTAYAVRGDGTMSSAAAAALRNGQLPATQADVAAKKAADLAYAAAAARLDAPATISPATGQISSPLAPVQLAAFAGQFDAGGTPPDTTGAIGPTRFVQLVNRRFGIYTRTGGLLSSGTLNTLNGFSAATNSFDPQIIWDNTTQKFYYSMDSVVSSTDNRLSFGFSKNASPTTSADWCKYYINYGSIFPDFPKMGDSQHFLLIGVNNYQPNFIRSDLISLTKPSAAAITTCPSFASLNGRLFADLRDSSNLRVFSPTPANSIDTFAFGYVIGRNLSVPSNRFSIRPITQSATPGLPSLLPVRTATLPLSYSVPASARQPTLTQVLDTSDTRMTQAVLSRNPLRNNELSLWTQQTVASGTTSGIRYYEINPTFTTPILRRIGTLAQTGYFLFNAAISSDRRADGGFLAFGQNFVIGYNASSTSLLPRLVTGSSVNGAAPTFGVVFTSPGPYRDFSCAGAGQRCRWGDYAGATPDPRPVSGSAVWLTSQLASGNTSTAQANWRTMIWAARP